MLTLHKLRAGMAGRVLLDDLDLAVEDGSICAVLGPSGAGKTTLLRAIAGLHPADAGQIIWNGRELNAVPSSGRNFGMVFQDYALFPHTDVRGNVEFGLRTRRRPNSEIRKRADQVMEMLSISPLAGRSVATLSGGEAQRVALARALAPRPELLLLDEPLGALEGELRARLVTELRDIVKATGSSAIHVTHDRQEAFTIGDRVALLMSGRIVRLGAPLQVWADPQREDVARFLGFPASVSVTVAAGRVKGAGPRLDLPDGDHRVVFNSGALSLDPDSSWRAVVTAVSFRGDHSTVTVRTQLGQLELNCSSWSTPAPGSEVGITIDRRRLITLPAEGVDDCPQGAGP